MAMAGVDGGGYTGGHTADVGGLCLSIGGPGRLALSLRSSNEMGELSK